MIEWIFTDWHWVWILLLIFVMGSGPTGNKSVTGR